MLEWTVKRRYEGDTRSAWFATTSDNRLYKVTPTHGCFLVTSSDFKGRMYRGDFRESAAQARALAEQWHTELLALRRKRKRGRSSIR